jgi:coenzyme F420 hydrogenase subunit delta
LFGDDGFGPAVVAALEGDYPRLPASVHAVDAGTGVRTILFTLTLSETRPQTIIVVDAVDVGRSPGDLFDLSVDRVPANKIADFSVHQLPTSNLLAELQELCGVRVKILACQVQNIPDSVSPGLSPAVAGAVPKACEMLIEEVAAANG